MALNIDRYETINKEILISNKYTRNIKLINNICKDNTKFLRKTFLDEVRVYKNILYNNYYF